MLLLAFVFCLFSVEISRTAPLLQPGYYAKSCPNAELIVRDVMKKAMIKDPRNGASVLRLQFHDCFVNGCDGSLLLDDTPAMLGEKLSLSNINSLRSYVVVDEIKEALESACPRTVSCADVIVIASRDAVVLSGGPEWEVKLGRKDSLTASQTDSDDIMPSTNSNASVLVDLFARFDLSVKDLVALSGSHSIGKGRCSSIVLRLYNQSGTGRPDPSIEPKFRQKLHNLCPLGGDGNVTSGLDSTPHVFDNQYFKDLVNGRGFLNSDETLFTFPRTRVYVQRYSEDESEFFRDFVDGMIKMGDLQSGKPGEIRRNCRVVNDPPLKEVVVGGLKDRRMSSQTCLLMNITTLRRRLNQAKLLFPFLLPVDPQNRLNQQAKPVAQSSHKLKNFQIYRWNPEIPVKTYLKNYEIDLKECGSMVFDALIKIKNEIDPTLSFRCSCREGICGACAMDIDGCNGLAFLLFKGISQELRSDLKESTTPMSNLIVTCVSIGKS
ncbi:hypothetical protein LXL04_014101 [Taraxacum kok-saghyz]